MASPGSVDDNLRQQYREQLQDRIAEVVARRRSNVGGAASDDDNLYHLGDIQTPSRQSLTSSLGSQGTPSSFQVGGAYLTTTPSNRAPPPTPATTPASVLLTPLNLAQSPTPTTSQLFRTDSLLNGGRSPAAPAHLEFGEEQIAPGFRKALSSVADRKFSTNSLSPNQTKEDEDNKENINNLPDAEVSTVWDGQSPVTTPPKDQHINDNDRRRSSVSSCQTDGSGSEASPRGTRKSVGTREHELNIQEREVAYRKKFLMQRENDLDQRSAALEKSRSQLLQYEAEVQAQFQRQVDLQSKPPSCRSRTWNCLYWLWKLVMYANIVWQVMSLTPGLELPKIILTDDSFDLQWPMPEASNTENELTSGTPTVPHECPKVTPCPEPTPCTVPIACPDASAAVIHFQVPWLVHDNQTGPSVSNQACLPAEARNMQLAFDWSSRRLALLQTEVDRLLAQAKTKKDCPKAAQKMEVKSHKISKERTHVAEASLPPRQKDAQKNESGIPLPKVRAADLKLESKSSVQESYFDTDVKQTSEQKTPRSWKTGAVLAAIIGSFLGSSVWKLVA